MAGLAAGLPVAGREREKPGKTKSFLAGAIACLAGLCRAWGWSMAAAQGARFLEAWHQAWKKRLKGQSAALKALVT